MTRKDLRRVGRLTIMAAGGVAVAAGCGSLPEMLGRPIIVQAGGLDCASAMLVELGYTITGGDRATGFVRGERPRLERGPLFFDRDRRTDVLSVSETVFEGYAPRLNVTVSRRAGGGSGSTQVVVDGEHTVAVIATNSIATDDGPSGEGLADAERLLNRCAGRALPRADAGATLSSGDAPSS